MEEQLSNYNNFVDNQQPLRINGHNSRMNFSNYNGFNGSSFTSSLNHDPSVSLGLLENQSNQQFNSQNLMQSPFNSDSTQQSSSFAIVDHFAQRLQRNNCHEHDQRPVNHVTSSTLASLESLEIQSNQQSNSQNLMQTPFNSDSTQQSSSFGIVHPLARMLQQNNSHEPNQRPVNYGTSFTSAPLRSLVIQSNQHSNSQNLMQAPFNSNSIQQSSNCETVDHFAQNIPHEFNKRLINNHQECIPGLPCPNFEQNPNFILLNHFLNVERNFFNMKQDLAHLKGFVFSRLNNHQEHIAGQQNIYNNNSPNSFSVYNQASAIQNHAPRFKQFPHFEHLFFNLERDLSYMEQYLAQLKNFLFGGN